MKKRLWWLGKVVISFGLIFFLFQKVDIVQLVRYIAATNLKYIFVAILIFFISWMLYTYKWQVLLTALGVSVSFKSLFMLNIISIFYSLFLPGQVSGEVVKGIKLAKTTKENSKVLASIVVDRATGFFVLILIALIGLLLTPSLVGNYGLALIAGVILLIIILLAAITLSERISSFVERVSRLIFQADKLRILKENHLLTIWNSLKAYRGNLLVLINVLIYSFLFQVLTTINLYMVCLAVDIRISFIALLWILAIVSILQLLPISIAGIGVREGSYVFFLGQYGISSSKAMAFSLVGFGLMVFWGLAGGVLELLSHFKTRQVT